MTFVRVCLDPSFFWIAEHEDDPEIAKKYFERVISMLVLNGDKRFKFFMYEGSVLKLYEHGIVPSEKHLESLFSHVKEDFGFNFQDVSRVLNEILVNQTESDHLWAEAILDIGNPIEAISSQIVNVDKKNISEISAIYFGFTWGVFGGDEKYYFPRLHEDASDIMATMKVEVSDVKPVSIVDGSLLSVKFEAVSTISSLLSLIDENEIWSNDADESALSLAINVMAEKKFRTPLCDLDFSFGPNFLATAAACGGIDGSLKSILMEKIIHILCAPTTVEISIFRKTKDANSGPRIRTIDRAVAHRVHLTKKHEAYRLLFWKDEDGHIEFANVGTKFEEYIY